jgi:putative restriction endonuclease
MVKAVFSTRVDPAYDDLPEQHYHFPKTYLRAVERAVNDWIVYYEPRRVSRDGDRAGGRQAYFATARVERIVEDPSLPDHYYALVSNYLEFDNAVPFRDGDHFFEGLLQREDGGTNKGAFGRAVRNLPDQEYDLILHAGYANLIGAERLDSELMHGPGMADEPATFERPIIESVVARPFRDAAFARGVKTAYDNTCAMTGLKIINGGGRAEVEAAHIRPVAEQGPDSVRNGVALCGTVHWMFDRGLLSIDDDYSILIAADRVPDTVNRMINEDRKLRLPSAEILQPHRQFLHYHRQEIYKG